MGTVCILCNKPLLDPESIVRCIGPDCWDRLQADVGRNLTGFIDRYCGILENDVILKRGYDNAPLTNVTHKVFIHSPKGYEWGNTSVGVSDLALNILWHFTTPAVALRWYKVFKHDFLVCMPMEGGILTGELIKKWIESKTKTLF